jgi:murein DD-endopeptidase MepM/ murein hydrolase activator NlpD
MSPRTFKLDTPHMTGEDIHDWQAWVNDKFASWNIGYRIDTDGDYGQVTRAATASMMRAWGVDSAEEAMAGGLTGWWRTKLRDGRRTPEETAAFESETRVEYRRKLREKYDANDVHTPISRIDQDSWGWHPGVHDGVDLICQWKAPLYAIVTGKVVRSDPSGWWGLGAQPSPGHPVSDGDGIIIVESAVEVGPFKPGMHFGYGHAEGATVKAGDQVQAGDVIGHAGYANAAHVHFMANHIKPENGFYRGVGDRDPRPYVDYARSHT